MQLLYVKSNQKELLEEVFCLADIVFVGMSGSKKEREKIIKYGLSERHARTILRLSDERERLSAIEKVNAMKMNVARCEIMVDTMNDEYLRINPPDGENYAERIGHFERSLESSLMLLREAGIKARATRNESGDLIYYTIFVG